MTQALYRKWRPQTFDQVVGQEHVTQTLRNALMLGRVGHAYLFAGLRGTGKTTMARLVAKAVNCLSEDPAERPCNKCLACQSVNEGRFLDLIEIDAASHTSVDDVRELREKVNFRPNEGRYKVYIIDEVHRFSGSAFDALLKTLEEPPQHAIFILATTEIHKVPATILSRCQRFDFRRLSLRQIAERLQKLAQAEGMRAESEALALIARSATGSMRDAESLLDQLAAANPDGITLEQVQATLGTIDAELVTKLVTSLVERDAAGGLAAIDLALDQGADLRQFARQIVDHLRGMLLIQLQGAQLVDLSVEAIRVLEAQAEKLTTSALVQAIRRFGQAEAELRGGWQPQLPVELALVDAIAGLSDEPVTAAAVAVPAGKVHDVPRSQAPSPPSLDAGAEAQPRAALGQQASVPAQDEERAADGLTLDTLWTHWPEVMERVRARDRSVQALLNSAQPGTVQNGLVTLHVAHEFARNKLNQERAKRLIEEALTQVLNQSCRLDYRVVASAPEASVNETAAMGRPLPDSPHAASNDVWADDPLVQAAREMGAEVRPINEGSAT